MVLALWLGHLDVDWGVIVYIEIQAAWHFDLASRLQPRCMTCNCSQAKVSSMVSAITRTCFGYPGMQQAQGKMTNKTYTTEQYH